MLPFLWGNELHVSRQCYQLQLTYMHACSVATLGNPLPEMEMSAYIHTYTHARTHTHTHARTHARTHTPTHAHSTYTHAHTHTNTHTHTHMCARARAYTQRPTDRQTDRSKQTQTTLSRSYDTPCIPPALFKTYFSSLISKTHRHIWMQGQRFIHTARNNYFHTDRNNYFPRPKR